MKIGSVRPAYRADWRQGNMILRFLALCEYLAEWFFFLFNTVAIFRFAIEGAAAIAIIYGVVGVIGEFQQRGVDRGVRVATLFAQIAQTHALPNGKGLRALKCSVEALAREGVLMHDINLSGAVLLQAQLRGATWPVRCSNE